MADDAVGSRRRRLTAGLLLAWLWPLAAGAQAIGSDETPEPVDTPRSEGEGGGGGADQPERLEVPYEVEFAGQLDQSLRELLGQVSQTAQRTDQPPTSLARLQRRARDDLPRLREALRSRGYYDSQVEIAVLGQVEPAKVVFEVETGPLFHFGEVTIAPVETDTAPELPSPAELGVRQGQPALAQAVLDAQSRLVERVRAQGFILAEANPPRVIVDHDRKTMDVTFNLTTGPRARVGKIEVQGLTTVDQALVDRRLDWREGELLTPDMIEDARRRLVETGLFRSVEIVPDAAGADSGEVPVQVKLTERKHRSVGVGVRFRTDEGPGGNLFFENRNLFGRGEDFMIELDGSGIGYFLRGSFRRPDFRRLDQSIIADAELRYDDTDAYTSTSASTSAGIERVFEPGEDPRQPWLVGRGSLAFRYVKIEDVNEGDEGPFGLLSLPLGLDWDTSNSLFNPGRGGRLYVTEEPFLDVLNPSLTFNKAEVSYSRYFTLMDNPRLVFATRGAIGSMFGASLFDIPADERFYAGGGGSVRGFAYQKAGPLDAEGDPIGGRSLFELAGEFRLNITDSIAAETFLDSGYVYDSVLPDFSSEPRYGAGVGARYYSPIGPLRVDVGFPLNRRPEDDAFQLYISVGQAF